MQSLDNNTQAFLTLVRAGLWEHEVKLSQFGDIDFNEVYRLAEEQSVVGLVAAGIEHILDVKIPQNIALQFVGRALQIEQRNLEMDSFVVKLYDYLREGNVFGLLVKGQGVAQLYERPLWRASGDVDLILDPENYSKAKKKLIPLSERVDPEENAKMDQTLTIDGFIVELHGKMPFAMSKKVDKVIESVLDNSLRSGGVCVWRLNEKEVFLPNPDNHLFLVFTHFVHHFFIEGVGLRQICDWCRLMWKYRDSIDQKLLESRIIKAGLMTEWRVFAELAVKYLGMPEKYVLFYKDGYLIRAKKVLSNVIKRGNFGHNNDLSYRAGKSVCLVNMITLRRRFADFCKYTMIFPLDSPRFFGVYVVNKICHRG